MCLTVLEKPVKRLVRNSLPERCSVHHPSPWLALSVHVFSLLIFAVAYYFIQNFAGLSVLALVLAYSVLAGLLSVLVALPIWWWWFNSALPWLVVILRALAIPAELFLLAFLLCWLFYTGIGRTRVPYYPSHTRVFTQTQNWLPAEARHVLDLGSGFGGCCFALQASRPSLQLTGIEMAFFPWLISRCRNLWHGAHCRLLRGDYRQLNWAEFDVVYAYLSPLVMESVWQQALLQMRDDAWLVSYEFDIHSMPGQRISLASAEHPALYIWRIGDYRSAL